MPDPLRSLCLALETDDVISWRCNQPVDHDGDVHSFAEFGITRHQWAAAGR